MSLNVLIADQSVPFAAALADALHGRSVSVALITGVSETVGGTKATAAQKADPRPVAVAAIPWNRTSLLSSRTVLLEFRNIYVSLDQAVLVFDAPVFAGSVPGRDRLDVVRIADEYIKGYMLLAGELASDFTRQKKGRLVFVVRSQVAPALSGAVPNAAIAAAGGAFIALAEAIAAEFSAAANPALQTLLVTLDNGGDTESLAWLTEQLEQPAVIRNHTRWVKAGSRGLFGKL